MRRWAASIRRQWGAVAWLTAIWILLWGDLSIANLLAGAVVAVGVMTVLPLPALALRATVRPLALAVLVGHFVVDLLVASVQVSWLALRLGRVPRGGVIGVRLRSRSDVFLTLTAELSCLVPGSVVVEAHRLTGMLYLHVLDIDQAGGIEQVRSDTLALEARVLRAFASPQDLARYGLVERAAAKEDAS